MTSTTPTVMASSPARILFVCGSIRPLQVVSPRPSSFWARGLPSAFDEDSRSLRLEMPQSVCGFGWSHYHTTRDVQNRNAPSRHARSAREEYRKPRRNGSSCEAAMR